MRNKVFYILKGNNGATYIFNTNNWESIGESLKFYKARALKAKVLKQGLHYYLYLKGRLFHSKLKSTADINQYLQQMSATNADFNIDNNCSALISPTHDKIIVNHHDEYFQKFAFGNSYKKVKKEAAIYAMFTKNKKHFQTSNYTAVEDQKDQLISFKLSNEHISTLKEEPTSGNLVPALLEFFKTTNQKKCSIAAYLDNLQNELQQIEVAPTEAQEQVLENIKRNYGSLEFPLGLVHRDFKPWNILFYKKPLIFDFEETIMDGLPLEDLFNYIIDPIIMFNTSEEVYNHINKKQHIEAYNIYLNKLDLKVDFEVFLKIYSTNRILFWNMENKMHASQKYIDLLKYIKDK
jgi:hypothetical protein